MELPNQTKRLWGLDEDDDIHVYTGSDGSELTVSKGEKTEKYGDFDIKIYFTSPGNSARTAPSHPELFRDFEAKLQESGREASQLYNAFQEVFQGKDPVEKADQLAALNLSAGKFSSDVAAVLLQLMMVEQEINYGPGGKFTRYSPPRDLLMSCLRWIESKEYENIQRVINAGYKGETPNEFRYDGPDIWTRPKY